MTERKRAGGSYRKAFQNKRKSNGISFGNPALEEKQDGRSSFVDQRARTLAEDKMMGFEELPPGSNPRVGWLLNMVATRVQNPSDGKAVQAIDLFFIGDNGEPDFRATIISRPYCYVAVSEENLREVETALRKQFSQEIAEVSHVQLEDISAPNHLASDTRPTFLKVECNTSYQMYAFRDELMPSIERNRDRLKREGAQEDNAFSGLDLIQDIREYDVAGVNRLAIDRKINVGYWYRVTPSGTARKSDPTVDAETEANSSSAIEFSSASLEKLGDIVERANPVVLAFDIECTKKPLKFPDPEAGDKVMMVSWMVDGAGFLVINRETYGADIEDFEYAPHKDYKGHFTVFNERDEKTTLERFFSEVRLAAPRVFVTYNGDFFDWPFIQSRALQCGLDMGKEIGMRSTGGSNWSRETRGRTAVHMDAYHWVKRDSHIPQGSRGLKAVTRNLLGFEPEEIPPEEMMEAAFHRPHEMAKYSVSDAVCTYYLYMKYVHPFTFSLCNIIPLNPDDVLRKGSGTLCEMLLMCEARDRKIIAPNKFDPSPAGKLTDDGHILESETYVGGHVEALRTGIFRCDLPVKFDVDVAAVSDLEKNLDDTLKFAISVEGKINVDSVVNYNEIRDQILKELKELREKPQREEKPLIYHLDVSAMYPNIILTNRLQPHAIVTLNQCAACDFNGMSDCQRNMPWTWRGEIYPASRGESEMIHRRATAERLEIEEKARSVPSEIQNGATNKQRKGRRLNTLMGLKTHGDAPGFEDEQSRKDALFRKRLKEFCKSQYRRATLTKEDGKTATVCQRENPFYVDTVRAFRDRRYEYKALLKKQKKALKAMQSAGEEAGIASAEKLVVLYDSLQLAHKCILNSFYGYVMRRGARWYSMEMAGVVTLTGALIIKRAREFIDKVGLPLELDTDGIWCTLPSSFPGNFTFETKEGRKHTMSFIGSIFNADVEKNFTNHQYQDLVDADTFEYSVRKECSIMFEVDGPYRAMVLPAAMEEGKSLKKRYAVFNFDGSLAELKGFEIKRRGELKLIKNFQGEIFKKFLDGVTIKECYDSVGATCNKWLDVVLTRGEGMNDTQLLELLVEQNNMSKPLDVYLQAGQKSCAITCAQRMAAFLGHDVVRDGGLATMYVIAKNPEGAMVTERAIPSMVFDFKPEAARRNLLRKWTKMGPDADYSLREIIDWDYYKGRLANAILKIVSIPAAHQFVDNPVPRIEYPPWLAKKVREMKDSRKQRKISSFFRALPAGTKPSKPQLLSMKDSATSTKHMDMEDIEDMPLTSYTHATLAVRRAEALIKTRKKKKTNGKITGKRAFKQFKSNALDLETRRDESRQYLINILNETRPDKRYDYQGWLIHAKKIWRAQRAARLARFAKKKARMEAETDWKSKKRLKTGNATSNIMDSDSEDEDYGLDYVPKNFVADLRTGGATGSSFFKKSTTPLLGNGVLWQVVSIAPRPGSLGEFRLWVLPIRKEGISFVPGNLHCIPLHTKRTLIVGSQKKEPPIVGGATVDKVKGLKLPRCRKHANVYRFHISEDSYQTCDSQLTSSLKDAKTIDAVYNSKTPLDFEAIINIGTICRPRRQIERKLNAKDILTRGLHLNEIAPKDPSVIPYLRETLDENSAPTISQAFLFGSHASDSSSRAAYLLVSPAAKLCIAFCVTPSGKTSVNLKRIWNKMMDNEASRDKDDHVDLEANEDSSVLRDLLPEDTEFIVCAFTSRQEAYDDIGKKLSALRSGSGVASKNRGTGFRTVIVSQWPAVDVRSVSQLMNETDVQSSILRRSSVLDLEDCVLTAKEFPIVRVASNPSDGNYLPIGWETRALATALGRFTEIGAWLPKQLALSRFAGIPVGNISIRDVHSQALDVLFGRELSNNNHVLWASNTQFPDLGGLEADDHVFDEEQVKIQDIVNSGCYRSVCIDAELSDIAIATLLSSQYVNQSDETDLAIDSSNPLQSSNNETNAGATVANLNHSSAPLDEMAASAPAFRILQELVRGWEKVSNSDDHPETSQTCRELLSHVFRWVKSESSLLYDPSLARFLTWLIRKLFRQLTSELQTLGATIVYASTSRLIIATPKVHTIAGLRYAGFLEKTIRANPLFAHVRFSPVLAVYSSLLFLNRYNYGALPAAEEADVLNGTAPLATQPSAVENGGEENVPHVRMIWDLARYFPVPVAVLWGQVVEEFIRRPVVLRMKEEMKLLGGNGNDKDSAEDDDEDGDEKMKDEEKLKKLKEKKRRPRGDGFAKEVRELVRKLTGLLLEKVQEIREKAPRLSFPDVPTILQHTSNRRRNAPLEFVRTLCHVLSFDGVCSEDVGNLRRSLLKLLNVREFAKESQFLDPALHVPLHNLVCGYCNSVIDLDLGRESRVTKGAESNSMESWTCGCCGHPYDVKQIEMDLVRIAQKSFTSYQVQDLICVRCKMAKRDNMSTHCACSGAAFELATPKAAFQLQVRSFRDVAKFYNFDLLLETTSWMVNAI